MFGRFTKSQVDVRVEPLREQARFLTSIILAVTTIFAVTDLIWIRFSTLILDEENLFVVVKAAAILLISYGISEGVNWRLRNDASTIAQYIRHAAQVVRLLVVVATLFIPLAIVTTIFMYLASATDRPLVDGYLAELDAALGFEIGRAHV